MISLGQKNTLAEYMILSGADNRPPMLDKDLVIRTKKYAKLSDAEKILADCNMKATNFILQGLPSDIYSFVNHYRVAKDSWERIQLLMQGDDPIACLNMAMAFLIAVAFSRFSLINNQLRTSSNPRNQATIQDGRVTLQQLQERQGEGHMARKCTQPKRPRNAKWYKEKAMLAEAQEARKILDEDQLTFPVDPGVLDGQAVQTIIPNNAAFQTKDLDTYDSDYDDSSNAKAVLMANISNYGSDVISEAQQDLMILYVIEQMSKQMINPVNNWEKANKEQNNESVIAELDRYKE
nr:hypothetical protein [Tanacetum cinerariifolium]